VDFSLTKRGMMMLFVYLMLFFNVIIPSLLIVFLKIISSKQVKNNE